MLEGNWVGFIQSECKYPSGSRVRSAAVQNRLHLPGIMIDSVTHDLYGFTLEMACTDCRGAASSCHHQGETVLVLRADVLAPGVWMPTVCYQGTDQNLGWSSSGMR